ncbi:helix-turn-helix domain-containing protein [Methylobacterium radiodurans]|uniref:HTH cro/C1-type domain-containing protein n=1 Tax=Methylobacterium radiodurans TaxID=2202828 RepID=A0A2U8VPZ2_9HYPH|nr:helix-turn-helix transcriptional regulator [Methylobacterium radiodurans]AWN35779.1 hypothetical protein DK427_08485 [Methylobacterium radiodurans]
MATPEKGTDPETFALRQACGCLLKEMRERSGHTQASLAKLMGYEIKTFVNQVELGRSRLPPDHVAGWARAFGVSERALAFITLRYYDPITFATLFGPVPPALQASDPAAQIRVLEETIADLSRILVAAKEDPVRPPEGLP